MISRRAIATRISCQLLASSADLRIGEGSDPKTPLDNSRYRLKIIFVAGINQSKEALDDSGCSTISFEVYQRLCVTGGRNLHRFLRIVRKIVYVKAYSK